MGEYHGYLLATIISVWVVIGVYGLRTWLRERKALSGPDSPREGRPGPTDRTDLPG